MPRAALFRILTVTALALAVWPACAQVAPQPAAPPAAAIAPAPTAPAKVAPAKREECTRLPLSDIAFGREATIVQARMRLGEYADKVAQKRGWKAYAKSAEVASCEVYIDFGPLVGTEYKCLLAATYCRK
jgi:hypothetical protein